MNALVILLMLFSFVFTSHQSNKRDHITEEEADLVRENQEIDKRIEVFIKCAERRLLLLNDPNAVQTKKEEENWGPLPKGTAIELLVDYKGILEEAEEKIEDAFERNKTKALEKAVSKIKEAAIKQLPQLRALSSKLTTEKEKRALAEAIEEAEIVTKASI